MCYNPICLHTWEYRGNMLYGCCPSCRRGVNVELGKIKFLESQSKINTEKNQESEQ
jgi:hypothetical protein